MFRACAVFAVLVMVGYMGPLHARVAEAGGSLPLIPVPAQVERGSGSFSVADGTIVSVAPGDEHAAWTAHYLAQWTAKARGLQLVVRAQRDAAPGSIRLDLDANAPVEQAQGYALDVTPRGIVVRARSEAGLFYGAVTLWQLLTPDGGRGAVRVPALSIRDWPRFAWRGLMLDSARHMQSVAEIEGILDQMALHKLDMFHWHLADDQGWRLEIEGYPKFTSVGAWRIPPGAGTHGEPGRYGGFYTQAQVRGIVAYAAKRQITVVPEIDMPGHAQAAVASYPDILDSISRHPEVGVDWGVNPWLYSVSDQSLELIRKVLEQEMDLFPSPFIHVGGDEAVKGQWQASPTAQARMQALGLKDEDALQSWFISRLGADLTQHGRRLVGWDEILEGGGLPANAVVESWHGTEGAVAAAKLGHDSVLAPEQFVYLDHLQSGRSDEPSGRFPLVTLAQVYAFDPAPSTLTAAERAHILGTEAALWTEFMDSPWEVQHALFPRLDAFAEVAWSPQGVRAFDGFLARLPAQLQRYRALGIDAADSAFAVDVDLPEGRGAALATGTAKVQLDDQAHFGSIHYTLDGSTPTTASATYRTPFAVRLPATIRAAAFSTTGVPLAAPRTRVLDAAALRTRRNSELRSCPGQQMSVRAPLLPDLGAHDTPQYDVDEFASCWIYPDARLDGVDGVRVDAARLPRNEALAGDEVNVVNYPARTAAGELEVHVGGCTGPLLADIDLPKGDALGERFDLAGAMKPATGSHDLCLIITAPVHGPMYAIGAVHLLAHAPNDGNTPAHPAATAARARR